MARMEVEPLRIAAEVLDLLLESPHPAGTDELREGLALGGLHVGRAALERTLRDFDARGLTVALRGRGRALTERGREAAQRERARQELSLWTSRELAAVGQSTLLELRESMIARRGIEREAARLVAERAAEDEIAALERIVRAQSASLTGGGDGAEEALDFHRALVQMCGNRFLATAADMIRTSSDALESLMFQLGATIGSSYHNHVALMEAIATHRPDDAERAMAVHMNELIADIDAWLAKLAQVRRSRRREE
jgi:DNA-binding FadR family transcriptional regulator